MIIFVVKKIFNVQTNFQASHLVEDHKHLFQNGKSIIRSHRWPKANNSLLQSESVNTNSASEMIPVKVEIKEELEPDSLEVTTGLFPKNEIKEECVNNDDEERCLHRVNMALVNSAQTQDTI